MKIVYVKIARKSVFEYIYLTRLYLYLLNLIEVFNEYWQLLSKEWFKISKTKCTTIKCGLHSLRYEGILIWEKLLTLGQDWPEATSLEVFSKWLKNGNQMSYNYWLLMLYKFCYVLFSQWKALYRFLFCVVVLILVVCVLCVSFLF